MGDESSTENSADHLTNHNECGESVALKRVVPSVAPADKVVPTVETFRYRVVYPGGTYLRISPALDADKTGEILEYGTVFEASKSLILDGVNYAKLADGSGWVFEKKDGIEILELVEVVRVSAKTRTKAGGAAAAAAAAQTGIETSAMPSSSSSAGASQYSSFSRSVSALSAHKATIALPGSKAAATTSFGGSPTISSGGAVVLHDHFGTSKQVRSENRFWREIRGKCGNCADFYAYLSLVSEVEASQPSISSESGPAMSGWMNADVPRYEQQVRSCIGIIASITRQCSSDIADTSGLESALWVLVHMGSRVAHAMTLAVDAANVRFEASSSNRQSELLRAVLEVGARTKTHTIELARMFDMLTDDIKNFLQRWVIVKSMEEIILSSSPEDDEDAVEDFETLDSNTVPTAAEYPMQRTPVADRRTNSNRCSWPLFGSWGAATSSGEYEYDKNDEDDDDDDVDKNESSHSLLMSLGRKTFGWSSTGGASSGGGGSSSSSRSKGGRPLDPRQTFSGSSSSSGSEMTSRYREMHGRRNSTGAGKQGGLSNSVDIDIHHHHQYRGYARGIAVATAADDEDIDVNEYGGGTTAGHRRAESESSSGFWGTINRQMKKFADPDMQFAGLIS